MIPLFDYDKYMIIMESYFSFQGFDFLYFDTPVNFYTLYRSTRKINTFDEFEYIGELLFHLNPEISEKLFKQLMLELGDRSNKHVIRTYSEKRILDMCDKVYGSEDAPYCRRKRVVLFNPAKVMTIDEKRMIVGSVVGNRKANEELIYDAIEELMFLDEKITYDKISSILKCSRQTVAHKTTPRLKTIIIEHNIKLKESNERQELLNVMDKLTNGGKDKLKIIALKKLTSIRDYELIKNVILEFFG